MRCWVILLRVHFHSFVAGRFVLRNGQLRFEPLLLSFAIVAGGHHQLCNRCLFWQTASFRWPKEMLHFNAVFSNCHHMPTCTCMELDFYPAGELGGLLKWLCRWWSMYIDHFLATVWCFTHSWIVNSELIWLNKSPPVDFLQWASHQTTTGRRGVTTLLAFGLLLGLFLREVLGGFWCKYVWQAMENLMVIYLLPRSPCPPLVYFAGGRRGFVSIFVVSCEFIQRPIGETYILRELTTLNSYCTRTALSYNCIRTVLTYRNDVELSNCIE